ncbi:MAG: hypothetical protein MJZ89_05480 [Paludibacteraceae bacterium]|nr:hypothetical protein [Paludibacteraceae bacterium]
MIKNFKIVPLLVMALWLCGCKYFSRHSYEEVLVEIGEQKLMRNQLEAVTMAARTPQDSAMLAEQYIRQWAENVLFYEKATHQSDPELEQLVSNYRRELYLHRYEERLVQREMDHEVSDELVEAYYRLHTDWFVLDINLIKGVLLIVPNGAPSEKKIQKWMMAPESHLEEIEKYAYQYATGYELFLDRWESGNQLKMRMPITDHDQTQLFRNNRLIQVSDSLQTYFLHISERCLVGDAMPLDFAAADIRRIILSRRQAKFLQEHKHELYNDAERMFRIHRYYEPIEFPSALSLDSVPEEQEDEMPAIQLNSKTKSSVSVLSIEQAEDLHADEHEDDAATDKPTEFSAAEFEQNDTTKLQ